MKKTLLLLLASVLSLATTAASAANEVSLLRANSTVSTRYGLTVQQPRFDVLVANLAYSKQVFVHLKKWDGTWIDVPLSFNRPADAGREIWSGVYTNYNGSTPSYKTWDLEFSVKYIVNGKTYWDNNGGANYRLAKDSGNLVVGRNIFFGEYQPSIVATGTRFYGSVTVRNIAPSKQVQVLYSTDGWLTKRTAVATFNPYFWSGSYSGAPNPNAYGFEEWNFALDVGNASRVDYAIAYTVNGQTFWDNNYGRNFTTVLQR